jgi:lipoprotein-anchoring transpeptidase ErfK/SrfK
MRTRLALIAIVGVLVLTGALAALAYDGGQKDRILRGTTVAGVDIGGMRAGEAARLLERRLGRLATTPLTLAHGSRRVVVAPSDLGAQLDADGLAARALHESRRGNPFSRTVREITGSVSGVHLPAQVTVSGAGLAGVVDRVRREIGHPARAADVDFTRRGLRLLPARNGIVVRAQPLEAAIRRALTGTGAARRIDVPVRTARRPRRTLADLRERYALAIGISRPRKELRLYRHLRLVKTYPIAIGQAGHRTRAGRYKILSKLKNPAWKAPREKWVPPRLRGKLVPPTSRDNPIEARWLGFSKGLGIHGTDDIASLGEAASHGCIRMSIPSVKDLFRRVRLGTPVFIV